MMNQRLDKDAAHLDKDVVHSPKLYQKMELLKKISVGAEKV